MISLIWRTSLLPHTSKPKGQRLFVWLTKHAEAVAAMLTHIIKRGLWKNKTENKTISLLIGFWPRAALCFIHVRQMEPWIKQTGLAGCRNSCRWNRQKRAGSLAGRFESRQQELRKEIQRLLNGFSSTYTWCQAFFRIQTICLSLFIILLKNVQVRPWMMATYLT